MGKNGILLAFLPIIQFSFDRFDVSLTNYGQDSREIFMTNLKKYTKHSVFERKDVFNKIFFLIFIHRNMGVLAEIFDINFRCFISIFTFTTLKHTYRLKKKTKTLMSIVCDKNIPCQKQAFLMSFLPIFHEKTTALMPIFC